MPIEQLDQIDKRAYEMRTRPEVLDFIDSHASYLGGICEVGGTIYFNSAPTTYWYPRFQIRDNDESAQGKLAGLLDGNIYKDKREKSWIVSIRKSGVVSYIADAIAPFAPSRVEVIKAIQNWQAAESPEERAEIARSHMETHADRFADIPSETYEDLIGMSEFVAGIFDGRVSPSIIKQRWPDYRFHSTNYTLLSECRKQFGGSINITATAGVESRVYNRSVIPKRDGWKWMVARREELFNLLQFIKPHVITKRAHLERGLALLESTIN